MLKLQRRADKGWVVKRTCPSKKVWCSGLGLCLEMSPVFDFGHFGQGLRCGLSFRHCRCHWIMAAWELSCFLTLFFLVPLCWYAVSKRQMLLIFCGRFSCSKQISLSNGFHDSTTELYFRHITLMSMLFQNKNNWIVSKTRRKISPMSSMAKLKDSRWFFITRWHMYFINVCSSCKV